MAGSKGFAIRLIAFHSFHCFTVTGNFDINAIDFFNNKSWFDMKFITEIKLQDTKQKHFN